MNINKTILFSFSVLIFLFFAEVDAISCEPDKYPPAPEIIWPPNETGSIPIDSAIIVKDFKSLSTNSPKLQMELTDSSGKSIEYKTKKYQSRRSVYNYEAGFMVLKPAQNLNPLEEYTFSVKASSGFAGPIDESIKFTTGDQNTLVAVPDEIDISYYFSEPGYYLSNCQTSTWDKATSLFFVNSKIEGYPLLLVLDSNLLKDVSFFHSSMKKRDLAILFLPNEKGISQCFDIDAYAVNGTKIHTEKLCKPQKCVKGRQLSKDEMQEKYEKHGAFGFSLIEFPAPKEGIADYCAPYPPLCREYWASVSTDTCQESN